MLTRKLCCWKWYTGISCYFHQTNLKRHVRLFSGLKPSFITDLSLDINLKELKEKHEQLIRVGKRVNIHELVNNELERKCSEVISNFSPDRSKMLKTIQLEHMFLYAEGYAITSSDQMTNKKWIEAMTRSSLEERLQYYLYIEHKANLKEQMLQEEETNENQSGELNVENDTSFICSKDETATARWGNHRLVSAMTHGLPLIFDMEYHSLMNSKEIGTAAKQMWLAYCTNQGHPQPFHLILTGCKSSNSLYRTLELRHLLTCHHFMVSTTDKSYLDLFAPSKLVYLSRYAKQVLTKFDPNAVYILGAYADPKSDKKWGPAKAKEQNIECLRLPIDEHIKWVQGSKDLYLQSMVGILLGVKEGEEWKDAFAKMLSSKNFKHYPR